MASDAQRVIEIIFKGVDKTGAAVDSVVKGVGGLSGGIENATDGIADFTTGAVKLEAGLLAAGAALTTVSVVAAGQFDSAFREINTLLDEEDETVNALRKSILDYARDSTQSFDDVTTSIYSAVSAGVDQADAVEAVGTAEKLAVAGRAELGATTVALVSTLNAYGESMDSASRFSDVLFTTVKQGQTTLPELAASLSNVTGQAATLEVPIETLGASIATLTAAGAPTSQAITAIAATLNALIKPTGQAKTVAKELGIEFNANAVQAKGLDAVLKEVVEATGGNVEQMGKLFGSAEALKAVLPLTGTSAGKFAESLDAMKNSTGATEKAFEKMADSLDLVGQRMQNAARGLLTEVGTPLLESAGGIGEAIAQVFNALTDNIASDGALSGLVDYVAAIMGDLEAAVADVARNLPAALETADLSGFQKGIGAVIEALQKLFEDIDFTTVDGLATAITLAGDAFLALSEFTGGVIESFGPMLSVAGDLVEKFQELSPEAFELAGNIGGFATQANALAGGVNSLLPSLEALLSIMAVKQAGGLIGAFGSAGKALAGSTGLIALLGRAGLVGAAGAAGVAVGTLANDGISALLTKLTGSEESLGTFIFEMLHGEEEAAAFNDTVVKTGAAVENVKEPASSAAQEIGTLAEITERAFQASRDSIEPLNESASGLSAVGDAAKDTAEAMAGVSVDEFWDLFDDEGTTQKVTGSLVEITNAAGDLTLTLDQSTQKVTSQNNELSKSIPIFDEITGEIVGYQTVYNSLGDSVEDVTAKYGGQSTAIEKTKEVTEAAARAQEEWNLKILEGQQELAIENLRSATEIAVAGIVADSEKAVAAFESINSTIESTGETLVGLAGLLGDDNLKGLDKLKVGRLLEDENERRDEALKLQKKLTEAQIKEITARAKALEKGDGLVKIEGDGLKPHLEAFMFEILEAIQVRVNADGLGLLLGAP